MARSRQTSASNILQEQNLENTQTLKDSSDIEQPKNKFIGILYRFTQNMNKEENPFTKVWSSRRQKTDAEIKDKDISKKFPLVKVNEDTNESPSNFEVFEGDEQNIVSSKNDIIETTGPPTNDDDEHCEIGIDAEQLLNVDAEFNERQYIGDQENINLVDAHEDPGLRGALSTNAQNHPAEALVSESKDHIDSNKVCEYQCTNLQKETEAREETAVKIENANQCIDVQVLKKNIDAEKDHVTLSSIGSNTVSMFTNVRNSIKSKSFKRVNIKSRASIKQPTQSEIQDNETLSAELDGSKENPNSLRKSSSEELISNQNEEEVADRETLNRNQSQVSLPDVPIQSITSLQPIKLDFNQYSDQLNGMHFTETEGLKSSKNLKPVLAGNLNNIGSNKTGGECASNVVITSNETLDSIAVDATFIEEEKSSPVNSCQAFHTSTELKGPNNEFSKDIVTSQENAEKENAENSSFKDTMLSPFIAMKTMCSKSFKEYGFKIKRRDKNTLKISDQEDPITESKDNSSEQGSSLLESTDPGLKPSTCDAPSAGNNHDTQVDDLATSLKKENKDIAEPAHGTQLDSISNHGGPVTEEEDGSHEQVMLDHNMVEKFENEQVQKQDDKKNPNMFSPFQILTQSVKSKVTKRFQLKSTKRTEKTEYTAVKFESPALSDNTDIDFERIPLQAMNLSSHKVIDGSPACDNLSKIDDNIITPKARSPIVILGKALRPKFSKETKPENSIAFKDSTPIYSEDKETIKGNDTAASNNNSSLIDNNETVLDSIKETTGEDEKVDFMSTKKGKKRPLKYIRKCFTPKSTKSKKENASN